MKVGILIHFNHNAYECIAEAARQGFDNGQISMWDMSLYTDEIAEEIKRACADFHFTVTAVWCGWSGPIDWTYPNMYQTLGLVPAATREMRIEELLKGAEFARKLGVQDIITHIGYLPDNPFHPDNIGVCQALKRICGELKKYNQYFLFETGEELPLSLVHLMNKVGLDNMGINFDPANLLMNGRGACPVAALEFLAPYIRGFHAKDALKPVAPELKKIEVPVGQGDADFPALIQKLREIGYNGSITIERENYDDPEKRKQEVAQIKAYLESLIVK